MSSAIHEPRSGPFLNAWATRYVPQTTNWEMYFLGWDFKKFKSFYFYCRKYNPYLNFKNEDLSPMYFIEKVYINMYSLSGICGFGLPYLSN